MLEKDVNVYSIANTTINHTLSMLNKLQVAVVILPQLGLQFLCRLTHLAQRSVIKLVAIKALQAMHQDC